jgi:hypothetical protein
MLQSSKHVLIIRIKATGFQVLIKRWVCWSTNEWSLLRHLCNSVVLHLLWQPQVLNLFLYRPRIESETHPLVGLSPVFGDKKGTKFSCVLLETQTPHIEWNMNNYFLEKSHAYFVWFIGQSFQTARLRSLQSVPLCLKPQALQIRNSFLVSAWSWSRLLLWVALSLNCLLLCLPSP